MSFVEPDDWTLVARCRGMEDALFPESRDQKQARVVCLGCPVRRRCLTEALDNRIEWGVWGGFTERERRALLRARPDVPSWAALLASDEAPGLPGVEAEQSGWLEEVSDASRVPPVQVETAEQQAQSAVQQTSTVGHFSSRTGRLK